MKELEVRADGSELSTVIAFVDEQIEAVGCSPKTLMQIELSVEEIFVNIANYAYAPGTGSAIIRMDISGDPPTAEITFVDKGRQYDPLAKEDPDVTLPAKDRGIGGLGIFLTKKSMDEVSYVYRDGSNVFTMKKVLV